MNWLKQQVANVAGTAEPVYGPSAIQSVAEQTGKTPYTELTKDDFKWTAMDSTCVETQSFYMMTDSGHIGLAQVLYSNVVGLRTTCQLNCKVFYPNEDKPHLWISSPLENHGFDEQKYCFFADNLALDLSEDGSSYTFKSATVGDGIVNLKITRKSPGFKVGSNGTSYFGTDRANPWGSMWHKFWPRCEVEGTIGDMDMKGTGLYIMALQGMKPHHAAAKWNFIDFQTPTYSAVMMEYTTPPSYGASVVNVGGIAIDGETLFAGSSNTCTHTEIRDDPDWQEPGAIECKWSGKTKDGKTVTAVLAGSLGTRLDKVDVMAEVPGFVKKIVGGLVGTRPFIFQFGPKEPLQLKVKIEGEEERVETGRYFGESTFICE